VWEGSVGSESYSKAVYEFPVECEGEFTKEKPLRGYDDRKENWPKCMYAEDCLVQMCAEGTDRGRRFFKYPRAWVIVTTFRLLHMFLFFCTTYMRYLLQPSDAPENCGFIRWVDPPPRHPHQEYIYYLQNRIFDLEREVSSGNKDDEEDDNSNGTNSQEVSCTDPYCNCPCHRNKGSPSPPPPLPAMGGYYGEGVTQFPIWGEY
jgi:hypothetical protein